MKTISQPGLPFAELNSLQDSVQVIASVPDNGSNKLAQNDHAFHDWYRFVLSFPPHLVRKYIHDFGLSHEHTILDPFCGTGTTVVEAKLNGIKSFGLEANPVAHFASSVKVDWTIDPNLLAEESVEIANSALQILRSQGIDDSQPFERKPQTSTLKTLGAEAHRLLLTNSISPLPLHKTLVLLECLQRHHNEAYYRHALLALANALVYKISNLRFGPEVGVGSIKGDFPVIAAWLSEIEKITRDLRQVRGGSFSEAGVYLADAREIGQIIPPRSVDGVITSPPYPNEKDYTRTTRLESVILGFINTKTDLRELKKRLVRSNTRGVYKGDNDDRWIAEHAKIQQLAHAIEQRRIELQKDSGFEKLYGTVTKLYFGGMARHLAELRQVLRPGAQLAYVVGDQASYLRVMIRTGNLLAEIAEALGYEVVRIDLFRTRLATATKEQLREEVVVLRWKGGGE
ncbi:MAG: site-specific DNA-methyltransferase [Chloroflexi bacterium]|nr:site-specific DNA-methyltransferase [Chloroflexota bacterium]